MELHGWPYAPATVRQGPEACTPGRKRGDLLCRHRRHRKALHRGIAGVHHTDDSLRCGTCASGGVNSPPTVKTVRSSELVPFLFGIWTVAKGPELFLYEHGNGFSPQEVSSGYIIGSSDAANIGLERRVKESLNEALNGKVALTYLTHEPGDLEPPWPRWWPVWGVPLQACKPISHSNLVSAAAPYGV